MVKEGLIERYLTWLLGGNAEFKLNRAERNLFNTFGAQVYRRFITVRLAATEIRKRGYHMYTVTMEATDEKKSDDPVVLVHGFGAGVAVWCANIAALAKHHCVHAFDLLGFGRSSRPQFSADPEVAEFEMVESIEDWRKAMDIEKMYLVAHSFGAYLATSYALKHPSRVKHLILVDPWGFPEKAPSDDKQVNPYPWVSFAGQFFAHINPLAPLRFAGPLYGPVLVKKLRPDLATRYNTGNKDDIYEYLYYCNAQNPTGETAFKQMTLPLGWAKRPMINRFDKLDDNVPVTFIYGSRSWIDPESAFEIQTKRAGYVDVQIILGAGHHVYADSPMAFNEVVNSIIADERSTDEGDVNMS